VSTRPLLYYEHPLITDLKFYNIGPWSEFAKHSTIFRPFLKVLNIPYRIVAIVSGALNNAAAKKLDLEAW